MFVIETVFIPEYIVDYRLEISDKFGTKLNTFGYMTFAVLV